MDLGLAHGANPASTDLRERLSALRSELARLAEASGRAADAVAILGVTKKHPREAVEAAIAAGLHDVGENYLQEAKAKYAGLPSVRKHFIGHFQTNKAKAIAETFDVVQSVDRVSAGEALAKAADALGKAPSVLIQVNISPADRHGVAPDEAPELARAVRALGLVVDGVMAIGPLSSDRGEVEQAFQLAAATFERVGGATLSLGMSGDYDLAVRAGSTMVRLGTAIFGARSYAA